MKKGYRINIEKSTIQNKNYRRVLYTSNNDLQLTIMSIRPQEDIGMEEHSNLAQLVRIESGTGKAIIGKTIYRLEDGVIVIIPRNTRHNIINTSKTEDLKIYVVYTAQQHVDKLVERVKKNEN